MNVRSVVEGIHSKIEKRNRRSFPGGTPLAYPSELGSLRGAYDRMYHARNLVGEMPPSPDTLRARTGKHLIRLVQRFLFWYTPQIRLFQSETTHAVGSVCKLLEYQQDLIETLQRDLKNLRDSAVAARTIEIEVPQAATPLLPKDFEFALQDHFRGSEADTRRKLAHWFERIRAVITGTEKDAGRWLDIGCGRGEWLGLVQEGGCDVSGIDTSSLAVAHCRSKGFKAEQAESLDYLSKCPDDSLVTITAFHVVEHLPLDCLLALLQLSRRKLRVGGVLVMETPNPANLLMGAHHFWNDPTHVRPIPADFLQFSLQYFGFEIAARVDLNPAPIEDHLPFTEIELVRRVNDHFYGPRDYGFIGQRTS